MRVLAALCVALPMLGAGVPAQPAASGGGDLVFDVTALCEADAMGIRQVVCRRGACSTFFLSMRNSGKTDFRGRLEASVCNIDYVYCSPAIRPVELPCSAQKVEPHLFCLPPWAHKIRIEVRSEGADAPFFTRHFDVRWISAWETAVLVVEEGSESRAFLAGAGGVSGGLLLFHNDGRLLPDQAEGFDAADAVVLGDFKAEYVPRESRQALRGWVERGGNVLVHATGGSGRFSSPLFRDLLGFVPGAPEHVARGQGKGLFSLPEGGAYLVPADAESFEAVFESSGRPFLCRRDLGLGSVHFCCADLSGPSFGRWPDGPRFLGACLGGGAAARARFAARLACEAVVDATGSRSAAGVLAVTCGYSGLFAAALVFVLLRPGRRAGLWLPALLICACSAPALFLSGLVLPAGVFYTSASVLLSESGKPFTLAFERACFAPAGAAQAVLGETAGRWVPCAGALRRDVNSPQMAIPESVDLSPLDPGSRLRLESGAPAMLSRRFLRKHGGLAVDAEFDCTGGEISANLSVRNDTGFDVVNARVVYGDYAGRVGDLPSGCSRTVRAVLGRDSGESRLFFNDVFFEGVAPGGQEERGLTRLGLHSRRKSDAFGFGRASWGDFRIEAGRFRGPALIIGNVSVPPSGSGLDPEPGLEGCWSLWVCSFRAAFAAGPVVVPGPLLETVWSPGPGTAAGGDFEAGPEGVRVLRECSIVRSVRPPFDTAMAESIEVFETSAGMDQSGFVKVYIYDWTMESWVDRPETHATGKLDPDHVNPGTGEVRHLFEASGNAETLPAIGIDYVVRMRG